MAQDKKLTSHFTLHNLCWKEASSYHYYESAAGPYNEPVISSSCLLQCYLFICSLFIYHIPLWHKIQDCHTGSNSNWHFLYGFGIDGTKNTVSRCYTT
jgi:hypothetical protein